MASGNIVAIHRPARTATSVRSWLATANRWVSCCSRTKARTTRMPAICSRSTRLTSSMRACIARKLGTIRETTKPTERNSAGTTTARIQPRPRSSRRAISTPPTIMIGLETAIRQVITTSICTCWTSLVVRVISDGAPISCTSRVEKVPTRWNRSRRRSRPNAVAVRAPNHAAPTEHTICTTDTASITPPSRQISAVSPGTTPSSMIEALRLGG